MPEDFAPLAEADEALVVALDGFEGPLDLLLTLARAQRVDLRRVSILQLAEAYLGFVAAARRLRIELAADYLVMAAWLAFLKSRLLLPQPSPGEGPSAEAMAERLAWRLERLEAMRAAAARLMDRPRLGVDAFPRGAPEHVAPPERAWDVSLGDLLRAYAAVKTRGAYAPLSYARPVALSLEAAHARLSALIGGCPEWTDLAAFLPEEWLGAPERRRSAVASTFAAALELARRGRVEIDQPAPFAPLRLRARHG